MTDIRATRSKQTCQTYPRDKDGTLIIKSALINNLIKYYVKKKNAIEAMCFLSLPPIHYCS